MHPVGQLVPTLETPSIFTSRFGRICSTSSSAGATARAGMLVEKPSVFLGKKNCHLPQFTKLDGQSLFSLLFLVLVLFGLLLVCSVALCVVFFCCFFAIES